MHRVALYKVYKIISETDYAGEHPSTDLNLSFSNFIFQKYIGVCACTLVIAPTNADMIAAAGWCHRKTVCAEQRSSVRISNFKNRCLLIMPTPLRS